MARRVTWGTPGRSLHYIFPRGRWAFLLPALAVGGGIAALLLLSNAVGLRTPVEPGSVISQHQPIEARCQECHAGFKGASNLRCQRCHDPAGAGRLTNNVHVLFGSRDAKKAAQAPNLPCADCHVDHRGRANRLQHVDEAHCATCHFRSISGHPEFAVLRTKSLGLPGIKFPHDRHMEEFKKKQGLSEKESCLKCHEPQSATRGRDMQPIVFDKHCASCHAKDDSVGIIDPVTLEDVVAPADLESQGFRGAWSPEEFQISRGKISKATVPHQDEWVLLNLRKLRREIDPEGYATERGTLLARLSQLQRRLALATPLAGLDLESLKARQTTVESEIKGADMRLAAQSGAVGPGRGLGRLDDILAVVSATGDAAAKTEAEKLKSQATALQDALPTALSPDDVDARRRELLAALDAVEAADPALRPRAEDLRRRLLALSAGENGADIMGRVKQQRLSDRERLLDEIDLRQSGIEPPSSIALLATEQRMIKDAIAETRIKLDEISNGPRAKPSLTADEKARKQESLDVLTAPCQKCHIVKNAAFSRVVPAQGVMTRATFVHVPHLLQAECSRCHAGIEKSKLSSDLVFKGIDSCRECHRPRAVISECQACHNYHPPAVP
jgi:hypothetical protein